MLEASKLIKVYEPILDNLVYMLIALLQGQLTSHMTHYTWITSQVLTEFISKIFCKLYCVWCRSSVCNIYLGHPNLRWG